MHATLVIRRYRQIGREMQFELAANAGGLSPYNVSITQNGKTQTFQTVPHRYGTWLTLPGVAVSDGETQIKVTSLGQSGCQTTAAFNFKADLSDEIPDTKEWIRQKQRQLARCQARPERRQTLFAGFC